MKITACGDHRLMADIWLEASVGAHSFIPVEYWRSNYDAMRERYLPATENYAFLDDRGIMRGFLSLSDGEGGKHIEAIFVSPAWQGRGAGQALLDQAKSTGDALTLVVYEQNARAVQFYRRNGFVVRERSVDNRTGHPELIMVWQREGI